MPANIQYQPVDWKPEGSLAAAYDAHTRNQQNWANEYDLENARLANIIKEKEAALAQDEMNSPEFRDWRLKGHIGKDQSVAATGAFDQEVLPGKVKVTKAEQQGKLDLQNMENEATRLERMQQILSQQNPLAVQQAMEMLDDDDDRAQLQEMLMDPAYGRQGVLDFLRSQSEQIRDTLARNSTRPTRMTEDFKHGNAMELEGLKGRNTIANTRAHGQEARALEQDQFEHGKYNRVTKTAASFFGKLNPDVQYAEIRRALVLGVDPISGEPLDDRNRAGWIEQMTALAQRMNAKDQSRSTNTADVGKLGVEPYKTPTVPTTPPEPFQGGSNPRVNPYGTTKALQEKIVELEAIVGDNGIPTSERKQAEAQLTELKKLLPQPTALPKTSSGVRYQRVE